MYPKNAASPPRIAVGSIYLIADGTIQTSGASVRVRPEGGADAGGLGTLAYDTTSGAIFYTPTQAETNYTAFCVTVYKASCTSASITVITSASGTAGQTVPEDGAITAAKLGADCITAAKIGDDAIAAEHLATGAITADTLGADCITSAKIGDDAIGDEHWNVTSPSVTLSDGVTHGGSTAAFALQTFTVSNASGTAVTFTSGHASGLGLKVDNTGEGTAAEFGNGSTCIVAMSILSDNAVFPAIYIANSTGDEVILGEAAGNITGNLSGSVNSVATGVSLANGAITNASLAGNMEIVFETDFGTNYNATRMAWATNAQDFVGTTAADPFNGQVVAASVTAKTGYSLAADQSGVTIGTVTLVTTTTTNTDMRGTDDAATAAALATAQADLDLLTGTDGAILATSQPNYAPNTTVPDAAGTAATEAEVISAVAGLATAASLATAQLDLNTITGADGVTLATAQGNYAPATATNLATLDTLVDKLAPVIIGTVTGAGTGTEVFVHSGVTATVTVDGSGNRSAVVFS